MAIPTGPIYEFGSFRLDAGRRLLLRDGELVPLGTKLVETLIALIENKGDLVEKDRLMTQVWPDTTVEESNLTHNISVLRKVLGQTPDGKDYIQTVPRRGYRFIGEVLQSSGNDISENCTQAGETNSALKSGPPPVPNEDTGLPFAKIGHSGQYRTWIGPSWRLVIAIGFGVALVVDAAGFRSFATHPLRDLALGLLMLASLYWHIRQAKERATAIVPASQVAAFRGLLPFESGDADRFYGREVDATAIASLISHSEFRFGVLYGDSGCGKTSMVQAGVLPRLEARGYIVVVCRSYKDPLINITTACRKRSNLTPDRDDNPISYLGRVAEKSRSGLIIICDQFEEFYGRAPNKQDRTPFLRFLAACNQASFFTPVKFLFVVRGDFLHFIISSFDEYLSDALVTSRRYHLQQFDEQQAAEVIEKSMRTAQWPVEAGLSSRIAKDLAVNGTVLPSEVQIVGEQLQSKRLFTLEQ
jgi:DNA-binding winged helix-turn-helix (wHTH) protein